MTIQEGIDSLATFFGLLIIIPLIGTGVYLTIRLRLVQMMRFGHSWKVIAGKFDDPNDTGDINHLQALSAALSATIGIGNIAGVATAIHFGGPGALFWMWVTAFVGMATKFSEATLAMVYRRFQPDGSASGGPMYYIELGLGKAWKPLAVIFAFCTIISSFGSGNTVQAFTVADSFKSDFGVPPGVTGLLLSTLVALVIIGGIRRIGIVASRLVPFMALVYIVSALVVIGANTDQIPAAFNLIFSSAFTARAGIGGFAGSTFFMALLWGVKRGLFSNESGQGSAPIAHAAAKTEEPAREGTVAMVGPFIDTLVICTLTGLTIITSGAWNTPYPAKIDISAPKVVSEETVLGPGGSIEEDYLLSGRFEVVQGKALGVKFVYYNGFVDEPEIMVPDENGEQIRMSAGSIEVSEGRIDSVSGIDGETLGGVILDGRALRNGSPLTAQAFEIGLRGIWGSYMVTIAVFLFALSTAISWSYYGDRATVYLFGIKGIFIYRVIYVILIFIGSTLMLKTVWGFGDIALSMMAIPNLIALLFLAPKVQKVKEEYFSRKHLPVRKMHF